MSNSHISAKTLDTDTILQIFADTSEHTQQGDKEGYCIVREHHALAITRKLFTAMEGVNIATAQPAAEVIETDCRSEEGVTVGLIDALIAICRPLATRDLATPATCAALEDLRSDSDALAIFLGLPPAADGERGAYGDAYQGAREDLAFWKRRALEAEEKLRQQGSIIDHLTLEAQGETRMGEPHIAQGQQVGCQECGRLRGDFEELAERYGKLQAGEDSLLAEVVTERDQALAELSALKAQQVGQEPAGEVHLRKGGGIRLLHVELAQPLPPGTKLYTAPQPAPAQDVAEVLEPGKIVVSAEPLRRVLNALVNAPHRIRELQVTREPVELFANNPINILIAEFEAAHDKQSGVGRE